MDESPVTDVGLGDGGGVVLDDDCAGGALPAAGMVAGQLPAAFPYLSLWILLCILLGSGEIISAWLGNQLATEKEDLFQVDLYKFRFGIIRCSQSQ